MLIVLISTEIYTIGLQDESFKLNIDKKNLYINYIKSRKNRIFAYFKKICEQKEGKEIKLCQLIKEIVQKNTEIKLKSSYNEKYSELKEYCNDSKKDKFCKNIKKITITDIDTYCNNKKRKLCNTITNNYYNYIKKYIKNPYYFFTNLEKECSIENSEPICKIGYFIILKYSYLLKDKDSLAQ